MIIKRVLNNNAALALDGNAEMIVLGSGVAFGAKPGDAVNDAKVEKVFKAESKTASRFKELAETVTEEEFEVSSLAIEYAQQTLGKKLGSSIYIALPDHIATAIQRYKDGIILPNPFKWDVRRFYPSEYKVGIHVNEMVENRFGIKFLDDEAAFIALHIVNAEAGDSDEAAAAYDITVIMQEICAFVKEYYNRNFDEESAAYYRFITHLKFLAQRLCLNQHFADTDNGIIIQMIEKQHPKAYACALGVKDMLKAKHDYQIDENETVYMAVHIARIAAVK